MGAVASTPCMWGDMKHDNERHRANQRATAAIIAKRWGLQRLIEGEEFASIDYTAKRDDDGPIVCAIEIKNTFTAYDTQIVDLYKARALLDFDVRHNVPAVIVWNYRHNGMFALGWVRPRLWEWNWTTKLPIGRQIRQFKRRDATSAEPIDHVIFIPNSELRPMRFTPFDVSNG